MHQRGIRELVARHARAEGVSPTPIEGLRVFRVSEPVERLPGVYEPSVCCIVQGTKRAFFGGATYTYDVDRYLCVTMPLPVEAEILFATPDEPVLGILLDLETQAMSETLVAYEAVAQDPPQLQEGAGLYVARADDGFATAMGRLLELLEDPVALRVLGSSRLRELLYAIIEGEAGSLVRQTFRGAQDITRVLLYLHENLSEPLSVDDLARRAGMSRAVFHRRFKAFTGHSPLQFLKALRLHHAAMQIMGGEAVHQAADAVGYNSASQFSREFRRHFGQSPKQWARTAATAHDVHARDPEAMVWTPNQMIPTR